MVFFIYYNVVDNSLKKKLFQGSDYALVDIRQVYLIHTRGSFAINASTR